MVLMAEGVRARARSLPPSLPPPRPPPSPHLGHNTMPIGQCDGAVRHAGSGVKKLSFQPCTCVLVLLANQKNLAGKYTTHNSCVRFFSVDH